MRLANGEWCTLVRECLKLLITTTSTKWISRQVKSHFEKWNCSNKKEAGFMLRVSLAVEVSVMDSMVVYPCWLCEVRKFYKIWSLFQGIVMRQIWVACKETSF